MSPACQSLNPGYLKDAHETQFAHGSQPHLGRHLVTRWRESAELGHAAGFVGAAQCFAAACGDEEVTKNVRQRAVDSGDQRASTIAEPCSRRRLRRLQHRYRRPRRTEPGDAACEVARGKRPRRAVVGRSGRRGVEAQADDLQELQIGRLASRCMADLPRNIPHPRFTLPAFPDPLPLIGRSNRPASGRETP